MIGCSVDFKLENEPVVTTYSTPVVTPVHAPVHAPVAPLVQDMPVSDKITEPVSNAIPDPVASAKVTAPEAKVSSGDRRYPTRNNRKAPAYLKDFTRK
jgi:hypothetical protein